MKMVQALNEIHVTTETSVFDPGVEVYRGICLVGAALNPFRGLSKPST